MTPTRFLSPPEGFRRLAIVLSVLAGLWSGWSMWWDGLSMWWDGGVELHLGRDSAGIGDYVGGALSIIFVAAVGFAVAGLLVYSLAWVVTGFSPKPRG